MGFFRDIWYGPESSNDTPQARSTNYVDDSGNVHDGSTVHDIPTRGDFKYGVTSGDALGMIAVYRATQVISTSCMQLSFDAFRQDEQLDPKPQLLRRPDPNESLSAFLEKTALSLTLNGNAFWRVIRDNQGRVVVLRVLNPNDVTIEVNTDGEPTGYAYKDRKYTLNEIKHLSHLRVAGDPRGRGPIQAAQAELRGALDARDYSANWFQESGVPTGLLSNKGVPLPDERLTESKDKWIASQGGQRGPAVLNGDWSWQPVYLSPEDAQWIAVRQFDTTAVSRLFGVPAALMLAAVEGKSETYSNISQAWVEFYRFTLIRYVKEIEDAFSDLLPRGTEVKANIEALLRPDVVTRYQMHTAALQAGFMSINEVRAIEGLEPAPDGDFKSAADKLAEQQAFAAPAPDEDPEEAADE